MAVDEMRVMRLAERRRRIVSGAELTEAGMSTSAIRHWVARNRLTRLHRGVYLVGPGPLDAEQSEIAAVLACGPGSVLAHAWSARRWGMPVAPKETNELLHGYEVDALWREQRLSVEVDSFGLHTQRPKFEAATARLARALAQPPMLR